MGTVELSVIFTQLVLYTLVISGMITCIVKKSKKDGKLFIKLSCLYLEVPSLINFMFT